MINSFLCSETMYQTSGQILLFLLATTDTPTSAGLETMFKKSLGKTSIKKSNSQKIEIQQNLTYLYICDETFFDIISKAF